MNILIIGGAGMIGRKVAERLARDGSLGGKAISKLTLYDVVPGAVPAGAKMPVDLKSGDLPTPGEAAKLVADKPEVIFHSRPSSSVSSRTRASSRSFASTSRMSWPGASPEHCHESAPPVPSRRRHRSGGLAFVAQLLYL